MKDIKFYITNELKFKDHYNDWYSNEDLMLKLRFWGDEIDFYKRFNDGEEQLRFRGVVKNIDEVKWIFERCFNINLYEKEK